MNPCVSQILGIESGWSARKTTRGPLNASRRRIFQTISQAYFFGYQWIHSLVYSTVVNIMCYHSLILLIFVALFGFRIGALSRLLQSYNPWMPMLPALASWMTLNMPPKQKTAHNSITQPLLSILQDAAAVTSRHPRVWLSGDSWAPEAGNAQSPEEWNRKDCSPFSWNWFRRRKGRKWIISELTKLRGA